MSATNRGAKRVESDFYATPKDAIENIFRNIEIESRGGENPRTFSREWKHN